MRKNFIITLLALLFMSCSPLQRFNRKMRSLDRYIERTQQREFKKEQRQLKREFKAQMK